MTRQQYIWGGAIAVISAVTVLATASVAQAAPLDEFQYDPKSSQLTFVLPDGIKPSYFLMAQPARIVVDIPDTQVGDLPPNQGFSGAVQRIEISQVQPQLARVILEMSPQAVFARGQVSLQNVGDAGPGKDRWLLIPLLADQVPTQLETSSAATAAPVAPTSPASAAVSPVELPPGMESVVGEVPLASASVAQPAAETPVKIDVSTVQLPEASATANVPPPPPLLQAGIIDRSAVMALPQASGASSTMMSPELQPPALQSTAVQPTVSVPSIPLPSASSTNVSVPSSSPTAVIAQASSGESRPSAAPMSSSGAVSTPQAPQTPQADLPPLPPVSPRSEVPQMSTAVVAPTSTPPVNQPPVAPIAATTGGTSVVEFGQLPANQFATTAAPSITAPATTGVVEFGQSLTGATVAAAPTASASAPTIKPVVALDNLTTGGYVVPAGTTLSLQYDQEDMLKFKAGDKQQRILKLYSPIVDSQGRVIAPAGSTVLGEFIGNKEGSQFTTQVLSIGNFNVSFNAQSEVLPSQKQVPSVNEFFLHSGIGAAGAALAGLNPLVLGGAAVGAAITYLVSPQETVIQPGQILQVKLTQDFLAAR